MLRCDVSVSAVLLKAGGGWGEHIRNGCRVSVVCMFSDSTFMLLILHAYGHNYASSQSRVTV